MKRVDNYGTIHYVGPHYERNVGNGQSTAEVITKYYYAQLGPYKRLIAMRQNGTLYYVHTEHLGGTNILSDSNGNEVGAIRYHGYGQTRAQTGSVPTDKKFTGQVLDNSTGLYYYGARYYDAAIGRFVQPDSIVPKPGNPQSLNRYSYTLNNPLKYTDPDGHWLQIAAGAVLGAAVSYGVQVAGNVRDNGLSVQAFTSIDVGKVAAGGVAGGLGAATFGASMALMGSATGVSWGTASIAAVAAPASANVLSGRVAQLAENAVSGQSLGAGLWDPMAMGVDAATAGAGPGLRAARGPIAPFVKERITRNMNLSILELVEDRIFLGKSARLQGSDIHKLTAARMKAEGILGLDVEHDFLGPATSARMGTVDYLFSPERIMYDIKTVGEAFPMADKYIQWSGGYDLERIDYDSWWR